MMVDNTQEQKLRDEVVGDAKNKAERLVARAKNDAAKIVENAKKEAADKRRKRLDEAAGEMDAKSRSISMGVDIKLRRHWLEGREQKLQNMLHQALSAAENAAGDEHRSSMEQLAGEAIAAMGACKMLVFFPEKDANLVTEAWLKQIGEKVLADKAATAAYELHPSAEAPAGIRLLSADGRKEYDNTYASRLEKMAVNIRIMLATEE